MPLQLVDDRPPRAARQLMTDAVEGHEPRACNPRMQRQGVPVRQDDILRAMDDESGGRDLVEPVDPRLTAASAIARMSPGSNGYAEPASSRHAPI